MKTTVKRKLKVWEIALLVGLAIFLISGALALQTQEQLSDKVVRLHVLANSDSEEDQALKLLVRDAILERAEDLLSSPGTGKRRKDFCGDDCWSLNRSRRR